MIITIIYYLTKLREFEKCIFPTRLFSCHFTNHSTSSKLIDNGQLTISDFVERICVSLLKKQTDIIE